MVYKQVSLDIPLSKMKKAVAGKPIQLTANELSSNKSKTYLHPENYRKIIAAQKANKGCRILICDGAINFDLEKMQGGSIWSWMKDKAYPWLKKNWNVLKPVASLAADAVSTAVPSLAPARMGLKALTGVGVKPAKGSEEMKAKMAQLRAMRKATSGKGFRLN